jgi:hypothetical protein
MDDHCFVKTAGLADRLGALRAAIRALSDGETLRQASQGLFPLPLPGPGKADEIALIEPF